MEKFRSFTAMFRKNAISMTGRVLLLLIMAGTWHCRDRHPQAGGGQRIYKNETQHAMTVTFPKNKKVLLQPRTSLETSRSFNVADRDVQLGGGAVFRGGGGGDHSLVVHTQAEEHTSELQSHV